ncbi:DUF2058 family protein [Silvanigrella aquatica]|uniref:Nucleoprotein/polynucleotide-associated enzyme n=1 Tax=Silvanigrella aquatica TaxID=1915309 RepID=A0A1L4CYX2_9BACT|nr:DUF2058 family protein [Silvanigrella aquatica]APJ03163.1 hypothetical protein AXG55_04290 [Silvanigrella aquatica]
MSLRDQLLKAGLVSKKQAQKVDAMTKKQDHDAKKNKQLADVLNAEKLSEIEKIEQEAIKRKELDKDLNKQRDLLIKQREYFYRARQILNSNCLNDSKASEPYYFEENSKVRKVMVTVWQREMLARGKLGIGRPLDEVDEFYIIPLVAAKTIKDIAPQRLLTLHSELDDTEEIDLF